MISLSSNPEIGMPDVLEQQLDSLHVYNQSHATSAAISGVVIPRASSTCPDLSEPSGNVKETISLYLGNLTYSGPMSTSL